MKLLRSIFNIFGSLSLLLCLAYNASKHNGENPVLFMTGAFILFIIALFVPRPKHSRGVYTSSIQLQNRDLRENYLVAVDTLKKNNPGQEIDLDQLTQGYISSECTLTVNNSTLQWPIVDTQQISGAPITPTMRLLPQQDSFVVGTMGYWLMMYAFTTSQANPDFTTLNNWSPITYPSRFANNNVEEWAPGCMLFWMGYISIEVNKKVLIPYWDCLRHYKAPIAQSPAIVEPNTMNGGTGNNSIDGGTDGYYPVEPIIVIGGGRDNVVKLNLPSNIPANILPFTSPGYNTNKVGKAVLRFRGIWAQNSTSVR